MERGWRPGNARIGSSRGDARGSRELPRPSLPVPRGGRACGDRWDRTRRRARSSPWPCPHLGFPPPRVLREPRERREPAEDDPPPSFLEPPLEEVHADEPQPGTKPEARARRADVLPAQLLARPPGIPAPLFEVLIQIAVGLVEGPLLHRISHSPELDLLLPDHRPLTAYPTVV